MDRYLQYLETSPYIDRDHPRVSARARELRAGLSDPVDIARACFEFVRDGIRHSGDHRLNPVTCRASEVLIQGTGYCYAKSHLLAALLRANGLPAGLCYQRLSVEGGGPPFCLHGLNAVYLERHGWYRIDARGNRPGVDAAFEPPVERLPFTARVEGEADLREIWARPLPLVVEALESATGYQDIADAPPDLPLIACTART